jgi:hypothetical protein
MKHLKVLELGAQGLGSAWEQAEKGHSRTSSELGKIRYGNA